MSAVGDDVVLKTQPYSRPISGMTAKFAAHARPLFFTRKPAPSRVLRNADGIYFREHMAERDLRRLGNRQIPRECLTVGVRAMTQPVAARRIAALHLRG